jgi:hypothetical protein
MELERLSHLTSDMNQGWEGARVLQGRLHKVVHIGRVHGGTCGVHVGTGVGMYGCARDYGHDESRYGYTHEDIHGYAHEQGRWFAKFHHPVHFVIYSEIKVKWYSVFWARAFRDCLTCSLSRFISFSSLFSFF